MEKYSLNNRHMIAFLDPFFVLIPKIPFSLVLKFGGWVPFALGVPHFVN